MTSIATKTPGAAPLRQAMEQYAALAHADYVSAFAKGLTRGRLIAVALTLAWGIVTLGMLHSAAEATRVVGHDTAPSIEAAQKIKSLLSDANANLANMTMLFEKPDGQFSKAFAKDIQEAELAVVDASQNITYGDEEKLPLRKIATAVADYVWLVGKSRAMGHDPSAIALVDEADTLMRTTIIPATEALDKANFIELTAAYQRHTGNSWAWWLASIAEAAGLIAYLSYFQVYIWKRSNRLINPGLAAATAVVVVATLWGWMAAGRAESALHRAKADAFDSIHALSTMQAVANESNSAESLWLLNYDDTRARGLYADLFKDASLKVMEVGPDRAAQMAASNQKFGGLIGDELANITFDGEKEAATALLSAWSDYVQIDRQMRGLRDSGHKVEALTLNVGYGQGQSNWAFARLDAALDRTRAINKVEFDQDIARSERWVGWPIYLAIVAAALIAAAGSWFGAARRLGEYEF